MLENGAKIRVVEHSRVADYGEAIPGTELTISRYVGKRKAWMPDTNTFKMLDHYYVQTGPKSSTLMPCDEFVAIN